MATSDVLIGSGNIVFDDGSGNTKASLFIDVNTPANNVISFGGINNLTPCLVKNLAAPSVDTDAANKLYVDTAVASIPQTPAVGAAGDVQFTDGSGKFQGEAAFNWTGTQLNVTGDIGATGIVSAGTTVTAGTGVVATTGDIEATAGNVILPDTNVNGYVESTTFRVRGPNAANYTRLTSQAVTPDIVFSLPDVVGSSGSFLKTDGTGKLSWGVPSGIKFSQSAKLAEPPTGANITLVPAPAQIDGVNVNIGDIVLLMAQTNPVENGLYERVGADLVRVTSGIYQELEDVVDTVTFVEEGAIQSGTSFVQTANPAIVGTDPLAYSIFSTQADAGGELYSIQFANPAGVFSGSNELKWDTTQLSIFDSIATQTTIELQKTSGNIISVIGDISATAGSVSAGTTVTGGTGVVATTGDVEATTGNVTAGATVQGVTLTDGTLSCTSGTITGGVAATFSGRVTALEVKTTSDVTLKTNITPLQDSLQQIKKIEGYSYNWKHDQQGPEMFGVLAQQLEEAGLHNMVSETHNGHKCVDYNQIIPLLLGAVKQMAEEIEELKK